MKLRKVKHWLQTPLAILGAVKVINAASLRGSNIIIYGKDDAPGTTGSTQGEVLRESSPTQNMGAYATLGYGNQYAARISHQHQSEGEDQTQLVSSQVHPYEMIWPGLKLPYYMLKDPQYDIESVPADKKACFVHVGKTAGSTVGCSLGFNLHCDSKMYDCDDETTTYFIFIVRHPLDRWISAFNYDNPSKDWEGFRMRFGEKHFNLRSKLYAECPFHTVNDIGEALSPESNVTDVCKSRAAASIDGTEHFGCHHYFNYQFHLEAIPENATIMALRTEHLIEDWNSVEYNLGGGVTEVLGQDNKVIGHNNVNKASGDELKYLSDESKRLICERLCNEIQNYKKILRLSINLSEKQVRESIDELMNSCPIEAMATTCNFPMPNITDKLIRSRGYRDKS